MAATNIIKRTFCDSHVVLQGSMLVPIFGKLNYTMTSVYIKQKEEVKEQGQG